MNRGVNFQLERPKAARISVALRPPRGMALTGKTIVALSCGRGPGRTGRGGTIALVKLRRVWPLSGAPSGAGKGMIDLRV